eukprot:jgi/Mesvir1/26912/Mv20639-RA.1
MADMKYLEARDETPAADDIFKGQIKKAPDGRVSAADIVKCIVYTRDDGTYAREALGNANLTVKRLADRGCIAASNTTNTYTFPGRNQRPTRVMTEEEVYELIMLLPGSRASAFRKNTAKLLKHYFHASEELIAELLGRYEATHGHDYPRPEPSPNVSEEPRIKQSESLKAAAAQIATTPRAKTDGRIYAKVFGIQNKSIMGMMADEFRSAQHLKKGDLIRDMWTDEMNSGAFFMNTVFKAAVTNGQDPLVAMEKLSDTMTPTFKSVGLHDQAKDPRPRDFLKRNKEIRESHTAFMKRLKSDTSAKGECIPVNPF